MQTNIQISLNVCEGKYLIAEAVSQLQTIEQVLNHGKLLLKGGTTVSAISSRLFSLPMRISGRITPLGCKGAAIQKGVHTLLVDKGRPVNPSEDFSEQALIEIVSELSDQDVVLISPNIFDMNGHAAMMAGATMGGPPGKFISGITAEGANMILPAGLEKLTPGSVKAAIAASGRKTPHKALGMGVGLIPLEGQIITEVDAVQSLGNFQVTVIGRGGIFGQEGGTTLAVEGSESEIEWLWQLICKLKGKKTPGLADTLKSCDPGTENCSRHLACIYKQKFNKS